MKIAFRLPDGTVENMHADPLPDGTFRLDNSPFHSYGISLGDRFEVVKEEGRLFFSKVAARGGHSTYRVKLPRGKSHSEFLRHWEPLKALGCTFEGSGVDERRLYSIDIPPGADVHAVYALLEEGEAAGLWDFEEGHYAGGEGNSAG
ncbi:MAG TPA: DUF4265 domain-containing protein [Allosphingosinicella sp.]|nr:DUF4265 domain-containing protein [Allosphingosinicella sp.]